MNIAVPNTPLTWGVICIEVGVSIDFQAVFWHFVDAVILCVLVVVGCHHGHYNYLGHCSRLPGDVSNGHLWKIYYIYAIGPHYKSNQ